jgi:hypothetical protein
MTVEPLFSSIDHEQLLEKKEKDKKKKKRTNHWVETAAGRY